MKQNNNNWWIGVKDIWVHYASIVLQTLILNLKSCKTKNYKLTAIRGEGGGGQMEERKESAKNIYAQPMGTDDSVCLLYTSDAADEDSPV